MRSKKCELEVEVMCYKVRMVFIFFFCFDKRGLNAQVIVQETLARHILIRVDELSSDKMRCERSPIFVIRFYSTGQIFQSWLSHRRMMAVPAMADCLTG